MPCQDSAIATRALYLPISGALEAPADKPCTSFYPQSCPLTPSTELAPLASPPKKQGWFINNNASSTGGAIYLYADSLVPRAITINGASFLSNHALVSSLMGAKTFASP